MPILGAGYSGGYSKWMFKLDIHFRKSGYSKSGILNANNCDEIAAQKGASVLKKGVWVWSKIPPLFRRRGLKRPEIKGFEIGGCAKGEGRLWFGEPRGWQRERPRGQFGYIRKGMPSIITMEGSICLARRAGRGSPPLECLWWERPGYPDVLFQAALFELRAFQFLCSRYQFLYPSPVDTP